MLECYQAYADFEDMMRSRRRRCCCASAERAVLGTGTRVG